MMYRRIVALICCVLLVTAVIPLTTTAEQLVVGVNLLENGDFEKQGAKWDGLGTWGGGSVLEIVGDAHNGNYAAKITTKAGDNPHLTQSVSGIKGGCKYLLSFWYKGIATGNGWSVKFEQSGSKGYSEQYSSAFQSADAWTKMEYEVYMPDDVTGVSILPRTYTEGTVIYIDDISFELADGPDMLDMDTDWVFYYQEYEEGTLTVTVDDFYDGSTFKADVKMTDDGKELYSENNLPFADNELVHKFSLKELQKKKEYKLVVTVKDGSGKTIETLEQFIYRIDRPAIMSKEGIFVIDGEIFEPVMADHFDINDSEDAIKAGINVIQWAPKNGVDRAITMAELDDIHKRGMKAAVVCYWDMYPAGHEINEGRIQPFVEMIKDHPAVFCYMIMDEPFAYASGLGGMEKTEDYLRNSYKIIRMTDDKHPIYCCEDNSDLYSTTVKYVDLLATDPYPARGDFSTHVGNKTLIAKEAVQGERMLLTTLQAFSWQGVTPSSEMLRTQYYQAFMGGTNAVSYYTWIPDDPTIDQKLNEGRYWQVMLDFNKYEKTIFYSYYARGEMKTVNSYRGNDYWYDVFTDGICYYAAVQLRKVHSDTVDVSLKDKDGNVIAKDFTMSVINGGKMSDVERGEDSFSAELDGYGAVLYKFTPEVGKIHITTESNKIMAYADGLLTGDKLYLAIYECTENAHTLVNVMVATEKDGEASCTITGITSEDYTVKAFAWSDKQGIRLIGK